MTLMRPEKMAARSRRRLSIGFKVLISRLISSVKTSIRGDGRGTVRLLAVVVRTTRVVDADLVLSSLLISVLMPWSCCCSSFQMSPGGELRTFAFDPTERAGRG